MQNGDRVNFTACTDIPSSSSDSTFYAQLSKNRLSIGDVPVGDGRDIVVNVIGTQTQPTASWIGGLDWPNLPNGLKISYYLPYENTGEATLDLTLPDNTSTGAVPVYFKGNVRLTTQFNANSTINLTYFTAGSISIDGQATATARWVCSDTIDAIQSIEPSDELGYIETTNTAGHTEKVSPYYGTAPSATQQMPFNFTSVKSSNLEDYTIYGNNNPNRIDETRTTLPMSVSAYGGNATDWEIYGNNNPVVENKTGTLPIDVSATVGNLLDWSISGNNNIGKNLLEVTAESTVKQSIVIDIPGDGTVSANGTNSSSSANMIFELDRFTTTEEMRLLLSGGAAGGSEQLYYLYAYDHTAEARPRQWDGTTTSISIVDDQHQAEVLLPEGHVISIRFIVRPSKTINNAVFKPMLRLPDTSATFEPYQQGVGERTTNFIDLSVISSETRSGVTFTVDRLSGTVTVDGTNTSSSNINFRIEGFAAPPPGNYYFTGCPEGGTSSTYLVIPYDTAAGAATRKWNGTTATPSDYGNGALEVLVTDTTVLRFTIRICAGYTANNLVFKPFLWLGDLGTTAPFIPYGYEVPMQAKQRTKNIFEIIPSDQIIIETGTIHFTTDADAGIIIANGAAGTSESSIKQRFVVTAEMAGQYFLSASFAQTSPSNTYRLYAYDIGVGWTTKWDGTTRSPAITGQESQEILLVEGRTVEITFNIYANKTVDNITCKPMVRLSDTTSDFEPYYNINQTDIYIGNSPLTQGQSITKAQSGQDVTLFSGDNIIDTSLYNKPDVSITYNSSVLGVGELTVPQVYTGWEQGSRTTSAQGGETYSQLKTSSTTRVRNADLIPVVTPFYYEINSGYQIGATFFDEDGLSLGTSSNVAFRSTPYTYTGVGKYVSFAIKNDAGTDITPSSDFVVKIASPYGYQIPISVTGENLFDISKSGMVYVNAIDQRYGNSLGKLQVGTYTLSFTRSSQQNLYVTKRIGNTYSQGSAISSSPYTFDIATNVDEVIVRTTSSSSTTWEAMGFANIMVTHSSTAPSTYIPYTATNYTFQLGSSPLTAGQSISKTSTGTDIALLSGTNTISTTLGNKPEMRIDYLSAEVGVGKRTVNLFDKNASTLIQIDAQGTMRFGASVGSLKAGTYTLSFDKDSSSTYSMWIVERKGTTYTQSNSISSSPYTFTLSSDADEVIVRTSYQTVTTWEALGFTNIMLVKGSTAPQTYIPYGYQIPITVSQQSQILDTKNIYIGTSLLTQGQSITKAQAGVDIYAPRGVDTMDSTLYNKPSMSLVATCGIDGYIDNKFNIFDTQQVIPKIQALHDKLKPDMDQRFGFPNGGYNWMHYYGQLDAVGYDDITLTAADIDTNYYEVSVNDAIRTSYTVQQKFNALTIARDTNERYIRALPEGDYQVLVAFDRWTGTAGAATFELAVDVTHDGSTTTSTITEASPYYYWEDMDFKFYYANIHVDIDTQEMGEVSIYDVVTLNYNFASSTSDYSDFDGAPIWIWIAEVGKFESEVLPDFEEMAWGMFYPVHDTVETAVNKLNQRIAVVNSILADRITALDAIINTQNAGSHNAIYRGKYLGTSVPSPTYSAIDAGTFDDLYVGDYWTINGVNWRIAAIDYYLNSGSPACTTHHLVIVPDTVLYDAQYHITQSGDYESGDAANTTVGGYQLSDMRTGVSSDGWDDTNYPGLYKSIGALGIIEAAFGATHILEHGQLLVNAVNDGRPSAGAWFSSKVELMSEPNVYGCRLLTPMSNGSFIPFNYTIDRSQYPLFAHRPDLINIQDDWWLRDVVSSDSFAYVAANGAASDNLASRIRGVRPAFCICKANPVTEP